MNDFLKHAPKDGKLNIHQAAGTYEGGGLRSIKGAKGIMYLEAGMKKERIDFGPEELRQSCPLLLRLRDQDSKQLYRPCMQVDREWY